MNTDKQRKLYTAAISSIIIFTALYFIVNVSVISGFLSAIFSILTPIIIGAAIAYLLNPILKLYEYKILRKLKSKSARRTLSIILTYVTALLILSALLWLVIPQLLESVMELVGKFDSYVSTTTELINSILNKFSQNPDFERYIDEEAVKQYVADFFSVSDTILHTVLDYLKQFGLGLFVGLKNALLGVFISIYLLISKERLHAQTRRLTAAIFKEKTRNLLLRYTRIANKTFGGFFIGMIFDASLLAVMTFIALSIFQIPYALLVAVIVGVTNIIPIFGPFIGAIPSAFIIFVDDPVKALIFVILIIILQQIDGNIIAPKILGNSIGISSLGVIVAIVIMGDCFGIVGMIIGVPVFAMIITVCNEIIETRLKGKGLPKDTADYYPAYSLVDPNVHHERPAEKLFRSIGSFFKKIAGIFKKKNKDQTVTKEEENKDDDRKDS